jgi:glycerophosphoryl diester phosphodiesterase
VYAASHDAENDKQSMKILTKETWNLIRQRWYHVFLFELLYRGLTCPIYLRLASRGLQSALQVAGYSYLTVENLRGFLLQPYTWVMLILIGFAGMLRMTVEIAGLMTAYQGSATFHKLAPFPVLWGAVQKTAGLLAEHNWMLGLVLLLDDTVMNLFYLARMLTHVKPASFVAQEIRQKPAYLVLSVLLVVLLIIAVLPTVFAGFSCMLEKLPFRSGMRRSRRLYAAHWREIFSALLILNLLLAAGAYAIYALTFVAAAVFVTVFTKRALAMAVLLTVTDRLEAMELLAAWTVSTTVNFALLSVLYKKYTGYGENSSHASTERIIPGSRKHHRIAIGVTVVTGLSLFYIFTLVRNGFKVTEGVLTEVQITAHRGNSRQAPENTIAAFQAAMDELADMAELDVQLTVDGEVVLGHDASLKRVAGINRPISSMTWSELEHVDVGSWFSKDFAGETIPRLADVMEFCKGRMDLNIELKNVGRSSELPDKVADLIQEYEMEEQCVVTSTSLSYLHRMEQRNPQIRTGYILAAAYGKVYSIEDVDFISIRSGFVNRSLVEQMHEQGKAVHAWTVNTKSEVERLCLLGVDNIITDYPAMAREIAYRDEATETLMEYLRMVFR